MRKVDSTARYARDYNHWLRPLGSHYQLGITDWAQYTIGQITQLAQLPTPDQSLIPEQCYLLLESDKATTELIAPLAAKIISFNERLLKQPELINKDCYGEGWLLKVELQDEKDWRKLESAEWFKAEIDSLFSRRPPGSRRP